MSLTTSVVSFRHSLAVLSKSLLPVFTTDLISGNKPLIEMRKVFNKYNNAKTYFRD